MTPQKLREMMLDADDSSWCAMDEFGEWVVVNDILGGAASNKISRDRGHNSYPGSLHDVVTDDAELMGLYARWMLEKEEP